MKPKKGKIPPQLRPYLFKKGSGRVKGRKAAKSGGVKVAKKGKKGRRIARRFKKSVAVAAGLGGTILLILFDKGQRAGASSPYSIVDAIFMPVDMNVKLVHLGNAAKYSLTNGVNYVPVAIGGAAHVGSKILHANIPVTKNWNLA